MRVRCEQRRGQLPEVGQVSHDQGIDGPEGDRRGDLLEGTLWAETGVSLRLAVGRQGLGPNRRALLGPGLAPVQHCPT